MDKVKIGDLVNTTFWTKITNVRKNPGHGICITVEDVDNPGFSFNINGDGLVEKVNSADFFDNVEVVTSSGIVDKLVHSKGKPFTVWFTKKDGTPRKLRGRLLGISSLNLGYLDVEDLDQVAGSRFRLVDCRTISSLIVDGMKYQVKKK